LKGNEAQEGEIVRFWQQNRHATDSFAEKHREAGESGRPESNGKTVTVPGDGMRLRMRELLRGV